MRLKSKIKIGDTIKGYEYNGIQMCPVVGKVVKVIRSTTHEIVGYDVKESNNRTTTVKYSYGNIEFISKNR